MPKNKNKKTYAIMSVNMMGYEQEKDEVFGPFANVANATDWATIGRGRFAYHTFKGTVTLGECEDILKNWRESE